MMAERLARLKESLDDPNLAYFEPCVVRELLDHIAQLEAQRGANVLATCANCAQRGHCVHAKLGEACEDHIVQRGGAVVVPELTAGDIEARLDSTFGALKGEPENEQAVEWTFKDSRWAYNLAVSRIQLIPADRVLGDGMVGVDREDLSELLFLAEILASGSYAGCHITLTPKAMSAVARLRSAKGEVEG